MKPITAYLDISGAAEPLVDLGYVGCDVVIGHNKPPSGKLTDNQKPLSLDLAKKTPYPFP